jgi:hypothetical protein
MEMEQQEMLARLCMQVIAQYCHEEGKALEFDLELIPPGILQFKLDKTEKGTIVTFMYAKLKDPPQIIMPPGMH